MSTSVGAQGQVGIARETTFGTSVTPTRFYPFTTEGIDANQDWNVTKAMRSDAPRVRTASMRQAGKRDARGPMSVEVNNKGFGMLLRAALGTVATTQPASGTDPTVYDHTFSPAATLGTEFYTVEVGWADLASSPYSKTLKSAMVDTFGLEIKTDELLVANFDWIGRDLATATSKTSPSYISGLTPFSWALVSTCTLGGVAADVNSCSIEVKNNLDADRFYIGGAGLRKQPIAPVADITATLDADFIDWTAYNRVLSAAATSLVITFQGATISNSYKYQLSITMNVTTDGETPKLTGPGRISQPLKLTAMDDGSGASSALSIVYRTTDSAV